MLRNKLRKSNFSISKIGLGTVQFGLDYGFTKKKTQEEVNSILKVATENNINLIDTAREYGDSEKKIGIFMENYDNDFLVATKIQLMDDLNNLNHEKIKKHIYSSVNNSLDDLKLDKLPILQLHQSNKLLYSNEDFWNVIHDLKKDKLIDIFGVSVYEIEETKFILKHFSDYIDFFQIPYNIFDRRFDEIQTLLNKTSVDVISRSTFLKGIIPCPIDKVPNSLEGLKPYKYKLNVISKELDIELAQLALIFIYYNDFLASTVLGVDSAKELQFNVNSLDNFEKDILYDINFDDLEVKNLNLIDPRKWNDF